MLDPCFDLSPENLPTADYSDLSVGINYQIKATRARMRACARECGLGLVRLVTTCRIAIQRVCCPTNNDAHGDAYAYGVEYAFRSRNSEIEYDANSARPIDQSHCYGP
jgi:hypothetical protein